MQVDSVENFVECSFQVVYSLQVSSSSCKTPRRSKCSLNRKHVVERVKDDFMPISLRFRYPNVKIFSSSREANDETLLCKDIEPLVDDSPMFHFLLIVSDSMQS